MEMKKKLPMFVLLAALTCVNPPSNAQEKPAAQRFEFAMIKWDGPDRIRYILPDKFEFVHLAGKHPLPKDAQPEEFYLTAAANELGKQGWEAVNLNSRRVLLRRAVAK